MPDGEDDDRDNDGVDNPRDAAPDDPTRVADEGPCNRAPVLLSVTPVTVRRGQSVTAVAQPITPPPCAPSASEPGRLLFPTAAGGVVGAAPTPGTVRASSMAGFEEAEYIVPSSAVAGSVVAAASYLSETSEPQTVNVLPARMEITRVIPAAAAPGADVTLIGSGFLGLPDDTRLDIQFPTGLAAIVGEAQSDRVQFLVPADAEGRVTVRVINGSRSASFELEVSRTVPVVDFFDRPIVQPGSDALVVRGSNLEIVSAVVFSNGLAVSPTAQDATSLTVNPVPVAAAP